jgi:hypothetical protein
MRLSLWNSGQKDKFAVNFLDEFLTWEKQLAKVTGDSMAETAAKTPLRLIRIFHA